MGELIHWPYHIKINYNAATGTFGLPAFIRKIDWDMPSWEHENRAKAMTVDKNDDIYVTYRRDNKYNSEGNGIAVYMKLDAATGATTWARQLGDSNNHVEMTGMTINDADNQLLISGMNYLWTPGKYTAQIVVCNPANGNIVDVWMFKSDNGDTSSRLRKLYVNGKQYFFLGINAYTDYIYWGKRHAGLFKLNQTYGYEDGFYLGSPWHNDLRGLDVDLLENYYLGWDRNWNPRVEDAKHWDPTYAKGYVDNWSTTEYDIMMAKVNPVSKSL